MGKLLQPCGIERSVQSDRPYLDKPTKMMVVPKTFQQAEDVDKGQILRQGREKGLDIRFQV